MASIRELRSHIRCESKSTKKITKAQELIATSRIAKAQARIAAAKPYAEEMTTVLSELASNAGTLDNPLLTERENPKRAAILVVTSDRGMCGGYDANVLKATRELISLLREEGKEAVLFVMGRKGVGFFNFRGQEIADSWTGFSEAPKYTDASTATEFLVNLFVAGSGTEVERPGGDGTSRASTTAPGVHPVPVDAVAGPGGPSGGTAGRVGGRLRGKPSRNYTFEPDADTLLDALLPKYVATRVYAALLDSAASESAARRTAMKAATDNAEELAKTLSREANQLRQAQITQEISEIVGGFSALAT